MNSGTTDFDPAWITENQDFLRRLARGLVHDEQYAEDVVQETWLGLWQAGAKGVRSVRAWMNTSVRNRSINHARARSRRNAREQDEAMESLGEAPAAGELEERIDTQTAVAEALRALPEPYRTTVFLRFYEDLAPAVIAQRLGVPVATVKTRLQRGLSLLRRNLDRGFGNDRAAWIAALAPWSRRAEPSEADSSLRMTPAATAVGVSPLGAVKAILLCSLALFGTFRLVRRAIRAGDPPTMILGSSRAGSNGSGAEPRDAEPGVGRTPVAPAPTDGRDSEFAWLRLRVVGAEQEAVAGVFVSWDALDRPNSRLALPAREGGFYIEALSRTDSTGGYELGVPSDTPIQVRIDDPELRFEGAEQRIESLALGKVLERTVQLVPVGTHLYSGRLVAEEDGSPIAGARVEFRVLRHAPSGGGREERVYANTVSDAEGCFTGPLFASDTTLCDILAAGRRRTLLLPSEGHATRAETEEYALPRSATLALHVNRRGELAAAELFARVRVPAYRLMPGSTQGSGVLPRELEWTAPIDSQGLAVLADLPPGAVFDLELLHEGRAVYASARQLPLSPDEQRSVEISLGSGGVVRGHLREPNGAPLAGRRVTARPTWDDEPLFFFADQGVQHEATTDETGAFELSDLAPGLWWIGPASTRRDSLTIDGPILDDGAQHVAPLCEPLLITPEEPVRTLELRRERGLYVRGRVLDADGSAAREGNVSVRSERPFLAESFPIDREGRFAAGPLSHGEYSLEATSSGGEAGSATQRVTAGAVDVVLQRRAGARLEIELRDASTLQPTDARLTLVRCGGAELERFPSWTSSREGRLRYSGLLPGRYRLWGHTEDGRVALELGLELSPNGAAHPLFFEPGARLDLQNGPKRAGFRVLVRGETITFDFIDPSVRREFIVPAGALELEWFDPDTLAPLARAALDLLPGEEHALAGPGGSATSAVSR